MRLPRYIPAPANPGASSTATIIDTGAVALNNLHDTRPLRVRVACYLSHAATFFCWWAALGCPTRRTYTGRGVGGPTPATTFFERDVLLMPGRNQITIVTVTNPTTWEVGVEEIYDQAMAQTAAT